MPSPAASTDAFQTATDLKPTFSVISAAHHDLPTGRREFAIDASREIAPLTQEIFDSDHGGSDFEQLNRASNVGERELHRVRKVSEVFEDRWRIRLPTQSLARTARTAGTLTTVGGILIGLNGLHEAATAIDAAYTTPSKSVTDSQIDAFYFAAGVFFGELVLMATPISATVAFRATGQLHSRLLWHRFKNHRTLYRLLLHHIYYLVRGVPSLALYQSREIADKADRFIDSILFLVRTTWEAYEEPAILAEIRATEISSSLFDQLVGLSLDRLQQLLGDIVTQLKNYIDEILDDLQAHYNATYEELLDGTTRREVMTKIVKRILEQF